MVYPPGYSDWFKSVHMTHFGSVRLRSKMLLKLERGRGLLVPLNLNLGTMKPENKVHMEGNRAERWKKTRP